MDDENTNNETDAAQARATTATPKAKTVPGKNYLLVPGESGYASAALTRHLKQGTLTQTVRVLNAAVHFEAKGPVYTFTPGATLKACSRPLKQGAIDAAASFGLFSTMYLVDGDIRTTKGKRYTWVTQPGKMAYLGIPLPPVGKLESTQEGEPAALMLWTFTPKDNKSALSMEFTAPCNMCRADFGKVIAR